MCKQHALRIAWTIDRSIAFLDFRVLRWKFTYDWKCVNTTYRVPLFCPLPASRKGLRLTLRSALFGEGGRDWRPCNLRLKYLWFSGYPTDTPYPPLPFNFPVSHVRHGGHFYHSNSMRVLISWTQLGPEHEINLRGAPFELVKTLLVLMTDVISEGSGEHVGLHNLVRVSLTNKV